MVRLHHVNLGVPIGGVGAQTTFLVDILRFRSVEPPADIAMAVYWFEGEDGRQIHLSEDPDHRPAARAHVAVEIDDLIDLEQALEVAGYEYRATNGPERRIVFCPDPAGNLWELRGPAN